jgi:hypothetical protein
MGEGRGVCRILVVNPEGKRPLERPRCRWEENIKMDLKEVGCAGMDWFGLAQDNDSWQALVSAVMNLRVLTSQQTQNVLLKIQGLIVYIV